MRGTRNRGMVALIGALTAIVVEEREHHVWHGFAGIIELIAGIVVVANPDIGFATLAILVGIAFILNGIGMTALGWGVRDVRREALRAA